MAKRQNRYRSKKNRRSGTVRGVLKTTLAVCTVVTGVLLLSAALAHCYHLLLDAPWLRVEDIQIDGLKHLEKREILNTLKVPRDANALTLKMPELAARLRSLPWLESSVVRLDLPGRIVVEVTEREPVAIICAEENFLMDKGGKLFVHAPPDHATDLLLVTGFSGLGLHQGSVLPARSLDALKRLLPSLEKARSWLPLQQISECRWQGEEGFVLYTMGKNVPVRLGTEDFEERLDRLRRVYETLRDRQWLDMVTGIDVDYSSRAYVQGQFRH